MAYVKDVLDKLSASLDANHPEKTDVNQVKEVLAQVADFLQLKPTPAQGEPRSLDLLKDVTVSVCVELGRCSIPIKELLKLQPGSVIELDRNVSQPVDLTVRGILFARGEVVVVEDRFAVRITELMYPQGAK